MAKKEQNASEKKNSGKEKKPGFFSRIGKWFRDLKSECKKEFCCSLGKRCSKFI